MKPTKHFTRFAIAAAIIALLSGFVFRGSFSHSLIVSASFLFVGLPLLLLMAIWFVIGLVRTGRIPAGLKTTCLVSLILGGSLLLSLGTGSAIHASEIRQVRAYVAMVIPSLEEYRKQHGHFPEKLADLKFSSPPKLLSNTHSYTGEPDYFRFEYWDAGGLMDAYYFDSKNREWTYYD